MSVDDGRRRIGSDPFAPDPADPEATDPGRRLRGRLAAPVTVWTAFDGEGHATGITVSSVVVAEGEKPSVLGLVGPLSEFWEAVRETKRFVVHVLSTDHVRVADQFALRYPGDPFEGQATTPTPWGPILDAVTVRARCRLEGFLEAGYQLLVRGLVEEVDLPPVRQGPLVHYRGRYLTTRPARD